MQKLISSGLPFLGGTPQSVSSVSLDGALIPFTPVAPPVEGWSVREHLNTQARAWSASSVRLLIGDDRDDKYVDPVWIRLRLKVMWRKMLNANALQFLIENRHLIPRGWSEYDAIGFFGTVYQNDRGESLCPVLSRVPERDRWFSGYFSLAEQWPRSRPIAYWL